MEVFDREQALQHAGGDEKRLEQVMKEFLARADRRVPALEIALGAREGHRVDGEGRALAVESGRVGAEGVEDVSARLADAAARGDWMEAESLFRKLEMELEWLKRVLDEKICTGNL